MKQINRSLWFRASARAAVETVIMSVVLTSLMVLLLAGEAITAQIVLYVWIASLPAKFWALIALSIMHYRVGADGGR